MSYLVVGVISWFASRWWYSRDSRDDGFEPVQDTFLHD